MTEHQRKIELQSPDDLSYLLDNVRAAARQQVDLHLPPSAAQGADDEYRTRVNNLVQQYINDTWESALPSLSVNGFDAPTTIRALDDAQNVIETDESGYEPFDTRLAQKLRDLYATLEEETTKVAELRREAPKAASQVYIKSLTDALDADDRELKTRQAELAVEQVHGLGAIGFSNREEIKESWEQSKGDLEELRNVTRVKADLERAIRAASEVEKR